MTKSRYTCLVTIKHKRVHWVYKPLTFQAPGHQHNPLPVEYRSVCRHPLQISKEPETRDSSGGSCLGSHGAWSCILSRPSVLGRCTISGGIRCRIGRSGRGVSRSAAAGGRIGGLGGSGGVVSGGLEVAAGQDVVGIFACWLVNSLLTV